MRKCSEMRSQTITNTASNHQILHSEQTIWIILDLWHQSAIRFPSMTIVKCSSIKYHGRCTVYDRFYWFGEQVEISSWRSQECWREAVNRSVLNPPIPSYIRIDLSHKSCTCDTWLHYNHRLVPLKQNVKNWIEWPDLRFKMIITSS